MPDKLTDSEIKKALEQEIHLAEYVDSDYCSNVEVGLIKSVLDLINRLQSKNKILQERNVILNSLMIMQKSEDEKLVGNIDRLKEQFENSQTTSKYWKSKCEELVEELETAKSEAYKEFIDKFLEKAISTRNYFEIKSLARTVLNELVGDGGCDTCKSLTCDGCELYEELVGEDNAEEKE